MMLPIHPLALIFPPLDEDQMLELMKDIATRGQLHPADLDEEGRILDGRCRAIACDRLGIELKTRTIVTDDPLGHVVSANLRRRHLDASQRAMVAAELANMQSGARTDLGSIGARSDADAAKLLNVSEKSVERAKAVKRDGTADVIKLVEDGKLAVSAAADIARLPAEEQDEIVARGEAEILAKAKEIRAERQGQKRTDRRALAETKAANAGPLPTERTFCVIYADPPWTFKTYSELGKDRSAENHYPTMTLQQICDLPVPQCAAEDAVLFLWATSPHLEQAFQVIRYWGFTYKSSLIWVKNRIGTGYWTRNRHEFLLIATRGDIPAPDPASVPDSVVEAAVGEHSAKPAIVRSIIEQMTPGLSRIELFARGVAPQGWEFWGFDRLAA
jgi:N6-adenosine-specific RNA methylase IME4